MFEPFSARATAIGQRAGTFRSSPWPGIISSIALLIKQGAHPETPVERAVAEAEAHGHREEGLGH